MQKQVYDGVQVRMSFLIEMLKLSDNYWLAHLFEEANFMSLRINKDDGTGWERVRSIVEADCMIFKGKQTDVNSCFNKCLLIITNKRLFVLNIDKDGIEKLL